MKQPSYDLCIPVKMNGLTNSTNKLLFRTWICPVWDNCCSHVFCSFECYIYVSSFHDIHYLILLLSTHLAFGSGLSVSFFNVYHKPSPQCFSQTYDHKGAFLLVHSTASRLLWLGKLAWRAMQTRRNWKNVYFFNLFSSSRKSYMSVISKRNCSVSCCSYQVLNSH